SNLLKFGHPAARRRSVAMVFPPSVGQQCRDITVMDSTMYSTICFTTDSTMGVMTGSIGDITTIDVIIIIIIIIKCGGGSGGINDGICHRILTLQVSVGRVATKCHN